MVEGVLGLDKIAAIAVPIPVNTNIVNEKHDYVMQSLVVLHFISGPSGFVYGWTCWMLAGLMLLWSNAVLPPTKHTTQCILLVFHGRHHASSVGHW